MHWLELLSVLFFALGMAGYPCCCGGGTDCPCCEAGSSGPDSFWIVEFTGVGGGSEFCADCSEFNGVSFEIPVVDGDCSDKVPFDTGDCNISVGVQCEEASFLVFFEVGPLAQSEVFETLTAPIDCDAVPIVLDSFSDFYCDLTGATATITKG